MSIDEDKLQVKLSIKKVGGNVKNRKSIEELGRGFEPLKEKLPIWVEEKAKELAKSD